MVIKVNIEDIKEFTSVNSTTRGGKKAITFNTKEMFDKFPEYGEFELLIDKIDPLSGVKTGVVHYEKCLPGHIDERRLRKFFTCVNGQFYNLSEMNKIRHLRVDKLLDDIDEEE